MEHLTHASNASSPSAASAGAPDPAQNESGLSNQQNAVSASEHLEIYGTLGPSCHEAGLLKDMMLAGMTGIRFNLSHGPLKDARQWMDAWQDAQEMAGRPGDLLIDLQGRELRIGTFSPVSLHDGEFVSLMEDIPIEQAVYDQIQKGDILLLDDGKIQLQMLEKPLCAVLRSGILESRKSLKIKDRELNLPALRQEDLDNLAVAPEMGVTGIMVPFVQTKEDLQEIHDVLQELDLPVKVYAKVENLIGAANIETFKGLCDMVVIARGDLANAAGLFNLPRIQMDLENRCKKAGIPYMIVTEMLDSMRRQPVCTRAEAMDVFRAVANGASAIMLTGETASGKYPLQAMETFCALADEGIKDRKAN